jgi:GTP cyclohydrolase I
MDKLVRQLLIELGEDPDRDGLKKTPHRVSKSLRDLTQGYSQNAIEIMQSARFDVDHEEIVLVRDIDFASLCEHHMLPFMGRAHVAYLPRGQVVGLSKLARVVEVYARRLQVQERMTSQIAEAIQEALNPHGVAVVVEASHLCMAMRGVHKPGASTVTSALIGAFRDNPVTRAELFQLLGPIGVRR